MAAGDIAPTELIVGGTLASGATGKKLKKAEAAVFEGVKAAVEEACKRINQQLHGKE